MVCINKYGLNDKNTMAIHDYCRENGVEVAAMIPFNDAVTEVMIKGVSVVEYYGGRVAREIKPLWQHVDQNQQDSRYLQETAMPGKMALTDYKKCHPERCDSGVCAAALACSHKLIKQEAPFETPMTDPSICQGCGDCVRACPLKAIEIVRM